MKMSCKIQVVPSYTFENLTELQYKAIRLEMLNYPSGYFNNGVQLTGYGGKKSFHNSYYYTIRPDDTVMDRKDFEFNRSENVRISEVMENILAIMDEFVENFKKVIEENEEPVSD